MPNETQVYFEIFKNFISNSRIKLFFILLWNHRTQKTRVEMANLQPTMVQNEQNVANAHEEPLLPITSFLRFLYTGSSAGSILLKTAPSVENIENKLSCVIDMATQRALLPINTIRKVN